MAGVAGSGRAGGRRGRGLWWMLALVLLLGGGAMLAGVVPVERLLHPARFAVTGSRLLPVDAYPVAARRVLRGGERIGALTLPEGRGPVIVTAWGAGAGTVAVYLDPPTARVLDIVARGHDPLLEVRPLAHPGQPVGVVVAHGAALAGGTRLRTVAWPSAHVPDWTLAYADGVRVKVADDRPGATAARVRDTDAGMPVGRVLAAAAGGMALVVALLWWRRAPPASGRGTATRR